MRPGKLTFDSFLRSPTALTAAVVVAACAGSPSMDTGPADASAAMTMQTNGHGAALDRDLARIRGATASYESLDAAVAAGYTRGAGRCVANPPHGAMGFHHQNASLLDDQLELERPEILVYERLPDGAYRFNGVEYIVPFSARPMTAEPPSIMGQVLKPAPALKLWYLHVWVWQENPSGVFSDWNPTVRC